MDSLEISNQIFFNNTRHTASPQYLLFQLTSKYRDVFSLHKMLVFNFFLSLSQNIQPPFFLSQNSVYIQYHGTVGTPRTPECINVIRTQFLLVLVIFQHIDFKLRLYYFQNTAVVYGGMFPFSRDVQTTNQQGA